MLFSCSRLRAVAPDNDDSVDTSFKDLLLKHYTGREWIDKNHSLIQRRDQHRGGRSDNICNWNNIDTGGIIPCSLVYQRVRRKSEASNTAVFEFYSCR
mmetsp:Transcript_123959/g.358503  ORF Transcript_123959/g.358503 Transcript_123959/m.358503 type:complete len:98 (-) Transcript_123959:51-344(-)